MGTKSKPERYHQVQDLFLGFPQKIILGMCVFYWLIITAGLFGWGNYFHFGLVGSLVFAFAIGSFAFDEESYLDIAICKMSRFHRVNEHKLLLNSMAAGVYRAILLGFSPTVTSDSCGFGKVIYVQAIKWSVGLYLLLAVADEIVVKIDGGMSSFVWGSFLLVSWVGLIVSVRKRNFLAIKTALIAVGIFSVLTSGDYRIGLPATLILWPFIVFMSFEEYVENAKIKSSA